MWSNCECVLSGCKIRWRKGTEETSHKATTAIANDSIIINSSQYVGRMYIPHVVFCHLCPPFHAVHIIYVFEYISTQEAVGWFNRMMPLYQYKKFHCGYEMILGPVRRHLHFEIGPRSSACLTSALALYGRLCSMPLNNIWFTHCGVAVVWTWSLFNHIIHANSPNCFRASEAFLKKYR